MTTMTSKAAIVFGANSEQGRAVVEGLVNCGRYQPVYAFTRETNNHEIVQYLTDGLNANVIHGDIQNPNDVKDALSKTGAEAIFLATTTELPSEIGQTSGYADAAENEYQVIILFFQLLVEVYQEDQIPRHVVFSVRDDVQSCALQELEMSGDLWINPLDDGSIVPHFTAKGKGGKYAVELLSSIPNLRLTLLTMPFLYSNFLGFFAPLQDETKTQWLLTACFGDGKNKIDMMSASDLSTIVPNVLADPNRYDGQNIRLAAQQLSMDEIAAEFSDLFGKDVVYNPLTVDEVSQLPFASAPCMAQMCQFLGDPRSLQHDVEATKEICFPRNPQSFKDWLLSHSESSAFQLVGLDVDSPEILNVTVFGATSAEGRSVVKGLLADIRKQYKIRATTRHLDSPKAKAIAALDPSRVELVYADFDDFASCQAAVEGVEGAFLVTDFYEDAKQDMDLEEQHAKNVIDACEASSTMKHLVFSTMESMENMSRILNNGLNQIHDGSNKFDAKSRAAAYARTKRLSVTYVLMPCYSENFFDMIERRPTEDGVEKFVMKVPLKDDKKVMCMSVDDLGPAVANIFDSYQVYAGHEIALVTDFVSVNDVRDVIEDVFLQDDDQDIILETEEVSVEKWVEATDTYMKDMGQMFVYMAHTDAVKMRHSIAKTMKLVPSARPLRRWVEQNIDNAEFREKLGLR